MAEITASLVKDLRERTGAGMMDCKRALTETDGDMDAAVDWLRKKGLAAAAKRAGRIAAEGLVGCVTEGAAGAVVEVNSETDFVARNDSFQEFVETVASVALANGGDLERTRAAAYPGAGRSVAEQATHLVATIGENIGVRRAAGLTVSQGVVVSYVHGALKPGIGRIGVIVALESAGDASVLDDFGRQLAMHVAAAAPKSVRTEELDRDVVDKERSLLAEQAKASGKPDGVVEKMVEGRLRKYYEQVVLLEQVFVIDNETKVAKAVEAAAKRAGAPITVKGFHRFALGEGIEKEESDFASEVAAQAGR